MITLFMFACLWICTAHGLKSSAALTYAFLLFIIVTAVFNIDSVYLLPIVVVYAAFAIVAVMMPWSRTEGDKPRHAIKRWWKHPRELFGYRIANVLLFFAPLPVLSWIGGTVLGAIGPLLKKRQRIMYENLKMIMPENANKQFMKRVWSNWGRAFVEGLKLPTYRRKMDKYIVFRNRDLFYKHRQFLIAMPHFGYMGLMSLAFVNSERTVAVTYKAARNPLTNDVILHNYGAGFVKEAHFIPVGNAIPMIRALRNGEILNINSDQRFHGAPLVDFMGVPAKTSTGISQLARKFDLPILLGHIERTRGAHHAIVFDEIVNVPHTDNPDDDEINGIKMVNDAMGRIIKNKPDEYMWMHRRWA